MRSANRKFRIKTGRIAVLNPLGDYGINQYVYQLCEGLAEHGVTADVFTPQAPDLPAPARHRRFHVLGSALLKNREALQHPRYTPPLAAQPDWLERELRQPSQRAGSGHLPTHRISVSRQRFLSAELVAYLRLQNYDWVWSQWPHMGPYDRSLFFAGLRLFQFPLLHTVHDVLPHERSADDTEKCGSMYRTADSLVVHSEAAMAQLRQHFPDVVEKAFIVPHMSYTLFPRVPDARARLRKQMGIGPDDPLLLLCGGVRPYKNIDGIVEAAASPQMSGLTFLVAGREAGYPDLDPEDSLGRTKRLVARHGITDRFRFVPRSLSTNEMAEIFEASDVALLPYIRGYGSGQLLLSMTFGKQIVATDVGGAAEYLADYGAGHVIPDPGPDAIRAGILKALASPVRTGRVASRLQQGEVARATLRALGALSA